MYYIVKRKPSHIKTQSKPPGMNFVEMGTIPRNRSL